MQGLQDHSRVDLAELKMLIVKKIGSERCRRYFYYLGRFLSHKLTKNEFDKSCYRLLGRENLALHNKLIRSILKNASVAKSPPPVHQTGHTDKSLALGKEDGPEQSGSLIPNHNWNDHVWSNGVLTKGPSPLGPNGMVEGLLHQPLGKSGNRSMENGVSSPFARQRSGHYADERDSTFLCRPGESVRIPNKGQVSRDDNAKDDRGRLVLSTSPVIAPLGIPVCSTSAGGARRTVPVSTSSEFVSCYDSGGLSDIEMLRKRMENIAVAHGLGGVSAECSSMLNYVLDVYLKKLIKSCVGLAGARSTNGTSDKQQRGGEIVNGLRPSNGLHIQASNQTSDITQEQHSVSLLDFRVAMELNPHQLGEDWPLFRERMSLRSFEEQEGV